MDITDKKPTYLYENADAIRHGDYLPDVSRFPVASVTVFPNDHVRVTFQGTEFQRRFFHGGPGYGFEETRIVRYES